MTLNEYEIYVDTADHFLAKCSEDFQCDLTNGVPIILYADFDKSEAWIEIAEFVYDHAQELEIESLVERAKSECVKFGIRSCRNQNDYKDLLCELLPHYEAEWMCEYEEAI